MTLNHHREDFKRFLKPDLSSAQPEVKYLNLCLGIKINRGLVLKNCGTIWVFHTIPQSLLFVSSSLFRSLRMELQSQKSGEDLRPSLKSLLSKELRTEIQEKKQTKASSLKQQESGCLYSGARQKQVSKRIKIKSRSSLFVNFQAVPVLYGFPKYYRLHVTARSLELRLLP